MLSVYYGENHGLLEYLKDFLDPMTDNDVIKAYRKSGFFSDAVGLKVCLERIILISAY